jgi:hypothetical protein
MYDQEDKIIISFCIIIIASVLQRIQRKKRQRKKWVRAWIQSRKHGALMFAIKKPNEYELCFVLLRGVYTA